MMTMANGSAPASAAPAASRSRAPTIAPICWCRAGAQGPGFLMLQNFRVIMKYNPAEAYALAIGHLADRFRGGGPFVQAWPRHERVLTRAERYELQQHLAQRGFDVGEPDGRLGGKTRNALRQFQSAVGRGARRLRLGGDPASGCAAGNAVGGGRDGLFGAILCHLQVDIFGRIIKWLRWWPVSPATGTGRQRQKRRSGVDGHGQIPSICGRAGGAASRLAWLLPAQAQFWDWGNRPQRQQQRYNNNWFGGGGGWFGNDRRYDQRQEREAPVDYSRAPAPAQKKPEATTPIVVMGDAKADWLAYGLEDALSEKPEIGVVRKHRTDSGLIRYDARRDVEWPQMAREIIAAEKPKFIVMMIGNNDRQTIREKAPAGAVARPGAPKAAAQPAPAGRARGGCQRRRRRRPIPSSSRPSSPRPRNCPPT